MKTAFLFFVIGAVAGGLSLYFYRERSPQPAAVTTAPSASAPTAVVTPSTQPSFADKAKATAADARDSIARKLEEWDLSSDDIKRDLKESGRVVRSKAKVAGEKIADAKVVTVIKAKYVLDRDLSALDINVDCRDGDVTLTGTVASAELLGKAMALALDTDGVHNVNSRLTLPATSL